MKSLTVDPRWRNSIPDIVFSPGGEVREKDGLYVTVWLPVDWDVQESVFYDLHTLKNKKKSTDPCRPCREGRGEDHSVVAWVVGKKKKNGNRYTYPMECSVLVFIIVPNISSSLYLREEELVEKESAGIMRMCPLAWWNEVPVCYCVFGMRLYIVFRRTRLILLKSVVLRII